MFVIDRDGTDFIIRPMHRKEVIHRADNQADIVASFNMMMMTMALDHSQEYKKAEITQFANGIVVVVNRLGDAVFTILSPIFDTIEEAIRFKETTVCKCGYGITDVYTPIGTSLCHECSREREMSQ